MTQEWSYINIYKYSMSNTLPFHTVEYENNISPKYALVFELLVCVLLLNSCAPDLCFPPCHD